MEETQAKNEHTGSAAAHDCIESRHYREEADRLRELLQQVEGTGDRIISGLRTENRELREWAMKARKVFECASFIGKGAEGCESCAMDVEKLLEKLPGDIGQ